MQPLDQGRPTRLLFRTQIDLETHRQVLWGHHGWDLGQQFCLARIDPGGLFDPFHLSGQFLARFPGRFQPGVLRFRGGHPHDFPGLGVPQLTGGHGLPHHGQAVQALSQTDEITGSGLGKHQLLAGILVNGGISQILKQPSAHDLGEPSYQPFGILRSQAHVAGIHPVHLHRITGMANEWFHRQGLIVVPIERPVDQPQRARRDASDVVRGAGSGEVPRLESIEMPTVCQYRRSEPLFGTHHDEPCLGTTAAPEVADFRWVCAIVVDEKVYRPAHVFHELDDPFEIRRLPIVQSLVLVRLAEALQETRVSFPEVLHVDRDSVEA